MKKIRSASLKIGKVLHDELRDIIDIYPVVAPANTSGTFAVYKRQSLGVSNTKDIYNYEEIASVEIVVCCATYLESVEKAIDIKMYLEHLRGRFKSAKDEEILISDITLTNCSEEWSNDAYLQVMNFDITMNNEPGVN